MSTFGKSSDEPPRNVKPGNDKYALELIDRWLKTDNHRGETDDWD